MELQEFDLKKALDGASIGLQKIADGSFSQYIVNFAKNGIGDYLYTGIGSIDGLTYKFNANGDEEGGTLVLKMVVDKISITSDTGGVRGDGAETYSISSLLPKDQMAIQILNGMLSRMTLSEIEGLSPARINQLSEQAYKMAQSMVNIAANNRKDIGKPEDPETPSENPTPTTNTETYLNNIGKAVDNLQKNIGNTKSGVFLNNTNEKPLYIQKVGESEGATTIKGNSNLGGGQVNIPIIVDSQSQSNTGAIPIKIEGGLQGQWRKTGEESKYSVNKICLNNSAFTLGLNSSDSTELIIDINEVNGSTAGLMSEVEYSDLQKLVTNVGVSTFSLGSSYTGKKLQEVLTKIDERLTALE